MKQEPVRSGAPVSEGGEGEDAAPQSAARGDKGREKRAWRPPTIRSLDLTHTGSGSGPVAAESFFYRDPS